MTQLTARDMQVLHYLLENKCASVDVIAQRFFAVSASTGERNGDPRHAAARRLQTLSDEGLLRMNTQRLRTQGLATLVVATAEGAAKGGSRMPGAVPTKGLDHHVATLRALTKAREQLAAEGLAVVEERLEFQVRSAAQGGRATVAGEEFDAFPDGLVVVVDVTGRRLTMAVEYVTSKYTDQMIVEKDNDFAGYARKLWVADSPRTAARVSRLVGGPCACT